MFTGLIESTARVLERTERGLTVARPAMFGDVKIGSSIAISGVCLTIVEIDHASMRFDVVGETWKRTKLGDLKKGDKVNLERAMRADARFEGHIVQGHVEGTGKILKVKAFSSIPRPLPPEEEGEKVVLKKKAMPKSILQFSREMRKNPTKAEGILWEYLKDDQLGVRFRRQFPFGVRILDFYCPSLRLAIEVDGSIHLLSDIRKDDRERQQFLTEEHAIRFLRFQNNEVIHDIEKVLSAIRIALVPPPLPEEGSGVEESLEVSIQLPPGLQHYVLPKGSITLDGVSLTVASIEKNRLTVALVPHTLAETTLGSLSAGDRINIETDILVRAVLSKKR